MKDPILHLYEQMTEDGLNEVRSYSTPPKRFRASEAADCVRKIWYRLSGYRPAPRDASGKMYGVAGDADHDITRQLFTHYGIKVTGIQINEDGTIKETMYPRVQFPVEHAGQTYMVDIIARADGQIETPRGDCLLEIKGTGYYRYDWLRKTYEKEGLSGAEARVKAKHSSWYAQCQVTMSLTGLKRTYLVVKDRASATLGVYREDEHGKPILESRTGQYIELDEAAFAQTLQRFAYVMRKLEEGKAPAPEFTAGSMECNYCPFFYLCHGATQREAAGLKPAILYPGPQIDIHAPERMGEDGNYLEEDMLRGE